MPLPLLFFFDFILYTRKDKKMKNVYNKIVDRIKNIKIIKK